jgi:hypothetical protein
VVRRLILPVAVLIILTPFFLWWLLRQPSPIATIQVSSLYGLAFSPDGSVLAIKDGEKLLLWNSQTRAIDTLIDRPGRTSGTLVFSPDGKLLASVDYIGCIRIRDAATWQLRKPEDDKNKTINLYKAPAGDTDPTNTFVKAAFSPDDKQLATCHRHRLSSGTEAGEIRIWDVASGELLNTLENQAGTLEVAYSTDGTLLALGNDSKVDWAQEVEELLRTRATASAHEESEALGVKRFVGQPVQPFVFHGATPGAPDPANRKVEVDAFVATGEIADPAWPLVVVDAMNETTHATGFFFRRRLRVTTSARGSPKMPRTFPRGTKPGKR